MSEKILVIVNPTAGGGNGRRVWPLVAKSFREQGREADFVETASVQDLREKAIQGAASGYRFLVALGGDGAFHHLASSVIGQDVVLGFIPTGNGNDIAAGLGIPKDPLAAARAFSSAPARPIDIVRASFPGGRFAYYVNVGGVGLDAEAARLANEKFQRWPGSLRYIAGALRAFRGFTPRELHLESDGAEWRGRVLFAAVANGPQYGCGVRIAPLARMDDGWLDVTIVREMPWYRLVQALPVVLGPGDWRWREAERLRARHIVIRSDPVASVHGDGELLGETPVELNLLPGAIRVAAGSRG